MLSGEGLADEGTLLQITSSLCVWQGGVAHLLALAPSVSLKSSGWLTFLKAMSSDLF